MKLGSIFVYATLLLGAASAYAADEWGKFTIISSTLGNNAGRLCAGAPSTMRPGDVGCPTYAPSLTTAGDVSITGNVSANKFIGDGSGLSGVTASSSDRITSGTTSFIVISDTGYISLTQAGTNTGWFSPYSGLVTLGVSSTGTISSTRFGGPSGVEFGMVPNGSASMKFMNTGVIGAIFGGAQRAIIGSSLFRVNNGGSYQWASDGNANTADAYLKRTAGNTVTLSSDGASGAANLNVLGSVGIGTTTPTATLQVSGSLIVSTTGQTSSPSLYVGTDGNVGIGTTDPSTTVHIVSNTGSPSLRLSKFQGGSEYASTYGNTSLATTSNQAYYLINGSNYVAKFHFSGQGLGGPIMIASSPPTTSSGFLSPSTTLHVSGTIRIADGGEACDANRAGAIRYTSSSTFEFCQGSGWLALADAAGGSDRIVSGTTNIIANQNTSLTFTTAGSQRMVIAENGNVGIGTANPSVLLQVAGTVSATRYDVLPGDGATIYSDANNFYVQANSRDIRLAANYSKKVIFSNNNTGDFLVANGSTGKVGIGNTNPQATLQVSGSLIVSTTGQTSSPSLYVGTSGYVGIGTTTPTHPLDILASTANLGMRIQNSAGAANLILTPPNSSSWSMIQNTRGQFLIMNSETGGFGYIGFRAGGSSVDNVRITNTGQVGIGTTAPSATLTVSGSAIVSGTVQIAGDGSESCGPGKYGTIRFVEATGDFQMCRP